ncbi:phosphoglucosamine mutase [Clostridia bacterium]|nr:phosphoglucosamine mutase [Clostridia bacterium]
MKIFGTDGARGVACTELTTELSMQIGQALATLLYKENDREANICIGMDTRISCEILECALIAGITSAGGNVFRLGVLPTPAVASIVLVNGYDAGIVISASHNSFEFNGIKIFGHNGYKLLDSAEEQIESLVLDNPKNLRRVSGERVGEIIDRTANATRYIKIIGEIDNDGKSAYDLSGIRAVIDCANGSASTTARKLFDATGIQHHIISSEPNGININDKCGSTNMKVLQSAVRRKNYDCGIAFDGDADRCLLVDENGNMVDGDHMLAICAKELGYTDIVVTVMTNIGFFKFAKENNINVHVTQVGDRYVLEKMLSEGYKIGGEQSGHVIFLPESTTGDGQLTALKVLSVMKKTGKTLSELASVMHSYPQVLKNVKVSKEVKAIWREKVDLSKYEKILGENGRVLVRESGTEPLIRVMLEGENADEIATYADEIIEEIGKL